MIDLLPLRDRRDDDPSADTAVRAPRRDARAWRFVDSAPVPDDDALVSFARRLGVPVAVGRLLVQRGHADENAARRFLDPRLEHLRPPRGLPAIDRAAQRVAAAIVSGERIAVCGDYDVDGMSGTALLVRFFRLLGVDALWAIPDRHEDGYGLSIAMVDRLAASGIRVAITVDNGVRAHDALERARAAGIDAIVTDHHLPGPTLPPAYAIVDPHLTPGGPDDATHLCGCALAFKLAWAIADRCRARLGTEGGRRFKQFLLDAMALVALATIADQMPLGDENRILVSAGLASLRATEHAGLAALREVAEVGANALTTEDVSFRLAPRLNAAGRLSRPELVVELLTCDDPPRARELARDLDAANRERREIESRVLAEALAQAEVALRDRDPAGLVVAGEGWHAGVIGIVAARLVDRFQRPALVVALDDGRGRGSGRTPRGIDLHAALESCASGLDRFGGHAMAAGFEVRPERVSLLRESFCAAVAAQREAGAVVGPLLIDAESKPEEWTIDAVKAMRRMEPFGPGNPEPVFLFPRTSVAGAPKLLGQTGRHLSFLIRAADRPLRVIGWGRYDLFDLVGSGAPLDLAVTPVLNSFRGTLSAELRLVDARPSASPAR